MNLSGDPFGAPVFYLHGTPGSRVGPQPTDVELRRCGVQLITFDRPGYGCSDRLESRTVADVAFDVEAIADHFGLYRFAVLGRSGGAPHALACAALLPERVTRAAALVSLAPMGASGLDWFAGMAESNVAAYSTGMRDSKALSALLMRKQEVITADPKSYIDVLTPEMPEADRRNVADENMRAALARNYIEGLRRSPAGWIDDVLAFCSPWGFDVSDIRVPVYLWHGGQDVFSPAAHTQWLANRIHGRILETSRDRAHFGAFEIVPRVLPWLVGRGLPVHKGLASPLRGPTASPRNAAPARCSIVFPPPETWPGPTPDRA